MKRSVIFLFGMIIYLSSFCQEQPISNVVNLKLPNAAEKLNKEQAKNFSAQKHFVHSDVSSLKTANFYSFDGLLMGFWDSKRSPIDNRSLTEIKSEALGIYKLDTTVIFDDASIKKINGHEFLILNYHRGTTSYYQFFSRDGKNETAINGLLECDISSKNTATNVFREILNSITFKEG